MDGPQRTALLLILKMSDDFYIAIPIFIQSLCDAQAVLILCVTSKEISFSFGRNSTFSPCDFLRGLKIAGWGATAAASAGAAYHAGAGIAAAAAVMKGTAADLGPHGGYHPAAAHHQLMADMYQGMSPATAINTMDWKNTSQVSHSNF